jgi:mandelate racemase
MSVTATAQLTVRGLRVRAVDVPLDRPIQTASGAMATAPLVLVDLETEEGVTGSAYVFCYLPAILEPVHRLISAMEPELRGRPVAPAVLSDQLRARFRLLGDAGLLGLAINGLDVAAWDALARAADMPLGVMLGGAPGASVTAYGSLGSMRSPAVDTECEAVLATGVRELKVKVGAGTIEDDLAVIARLREVAGDGVTLMVDYNQSLTVDEALRRLERLDAEGLGWVEEPVSAADVHGMARVAAAARTPIQAGESWWSPAEAAYSIAARGSDHAMLDVGRIGGVTGWQRAAALAAAGSLPISSHIYAEVSVHLLGATPGAHRLEYLPGAAPVLQEPLRVVDGRVSAPETPGAGIAWDESVVARHRVA